MEPLTLIDQETEMTLPKITRSGIGCNALLAATANDQRGFMHITDYACIVADPPWTPDLGSNDDC